MTLYRVIYLHSYVPLIVVSYINTLLVKSRFLKTAKIRKDKQNKTTAFAEETDLIHCVFCLAAGRQPLQKRVLWRVL